LLTTHFGAFEEKQNLLLDNVIVVDDEQKLGDDDY